MSEIQALELKITDNAQKAADGLLALEKALNKVRSAIAGGFNAGAVADGLQRITSAVNGITETAVNRMERMAKAMETMSKFSKAKMPGFGDSVGRTGTGKKSSFAETVAAYEKPIDWTLGDNAEAFTRHFTGYLNTAGSALSTFVRRWDSETSKMQDWKSGAIQGEGVVFDPDTLERLSEPGNIMGYLPQAAEEGIDSLGRVSSQLNDTSRTAAELREELERLQHELEQKSENGMFDMKELAEYGKRIADIKQHLHDLESEGIRAGSTGGSEAVQSAVERATSGYEQFGDAVRAANSEVENVQSRMVDAGKAARDAGSHARDAAKDVDKAGKSAKHASGMFAKLAHTFGRILMYRAIRAILREIMEGFKEGVTNVREYSKAIDSSFYKAMDRANMATLKMKNSLGAMLAPALEALVPVLQTVTGWVISAANAINQLISILTGKDTWVRAIDVTNDALDDTKKSAGGAAKEVKNLLADFDELNIIQSQPSGGGAGSIKQDAQDYTKMFETVSKFDDWAKKLKDNLDEILGIVGLIGAGILAWKFANGISDAATFASKLSKIMTIATGVATMLINVQLQYKFNKNFLTTGNLSNLIYKGLSDLVSTAIVYGTFKKVGGANAGYYAAAVNLTLSGVTDIIMAAGDVSDHGVKWSNMLLTAIGVAKTGLAGAFVAKALGTVTPIAGAGLSIALTGTISLILSMASQIDYAGDFDATAQAALAGASFLGGGFAFMLGKAVPALKMLATPAGFAAGFGLTAMVGLSIASVKMMQQGRPNVQKITLAAIGAAIGGAIGAFGIATLFGVGGAAAFTIAGATAIAVGVSLAVAAVVINSQKRNPKIQWGDIELTKEQVQQFASRQMFTIDVQAAISVISNRIESVQASKAGIRTKLTQALGTFNVIKLGVASEQDYVQLEQDVNGIVNAVDDYVAEAKELGKLTLQFTPTLVGDDTADAAEWFSGYTSGWDTVNKYVADRGAKIGKLLTTEEGKAILDSKPEVLAALMEQLTDVTSAIANAKVSSAAFANMKFSLGDLTKASATEVAEAFTKYQNELRTEYQKLVEEQYVAQGQLVAALFKIDPEGEEYKRALATWEEMGKNLNKAVEDAVDEASKPGSEMIRKLIDERYGKVLEATTLPAFWGDLGLGRIIQSQLEKGITDKQVLQGLIADITGIEKELLEAVGSTGWEYLSEERKERIVKTFESMNMTDILKRALAGTGAEKEIEELGKKLGISFGGGVVEGTKEATTGQGLFGQLLQIGGNGLSGLFQDLFGGVAKKGEEAKGFLQHVWQDLPNWMGDNVTKPVVRDAQRTGNKVQLVANDTGNIIAIAISDGVKTADKATEDATDSIEGQWNAMVPVVTNDGTLISIGLRDNFVQISQDAADAMGDVGESFGTLPGAAEITGTETKTVWQRLMDDVAKIFEQGEGQATNPWKGTPKWFKNNVTDGIRRTFKSADFEGMGKYTVAELQKGITGSAPIEVIEYVYLSLQSFKTVEEFIETVRGNKETTQYIDLEKYGEWKDVADWIHLSFSDPVYAQKVGLDLDKWNSVSAWIEDLIAKDPAHVKEKIGLEPDDWTSVKAWVETLLADKSGKKIVDVPVDLVQKWTGTVIDWVSKLTGTNYVQAGVTLAQKWAGSIVDWATKLVGDGSVKVPVSLKKDPNSKKVSFEIGGKVLSNGDIQEVYLKASGGFPKTGQMFIAREAGPELVGTIGNKTAVANNDQIVAGVASGVAAGQGEQNALLRRIDERLRRLESKEFVAQVGEPSTAWGRFNRASEELRARTEG